MVHPIQIRSKFFRCLDCTKPDLSVGAASDTASKIAASVATKKKNEETWSPSQRPIDLCQACHGGSRRGPCNRTHRLVTSDASASCWAFRWEALPNAKQPSADQISDLQSRELDANDYQRLLDFFQRAAPPPLPDYLVGWLREGEMLEGRCSLCAAEPPSTRISRILACGHAVHHHCVLNAVTLHHTMNSQSMDTLQCPQCKNPLFSALSRRPVLQPKIAAGPEPIGLDNNFPVRGISVGPSRSFSATCLPESGGRAVCMNRAVSSSPPPSARQCRRQLPDPAGGQTAGLSGNLAIITRDTIGRGQSLAAAERTNRSRRPPRNVAVLRSRTPNARLTPFDPSAFEIQGVQVQQQNNTESES